MWMKQKEGVAKMRPHILCARVTLGLVGFWILLWMRQGATGGIVAEELYNLACFKRITLTGNFKLDVQIGLERPVGKAIEVIQVRDGGSF